MRSPAGLSAAGRRLWKSVHEVFDLTDKPHKVRMLDQACRVADIVAELDEAAEEAPLTVKGLDGPAGHQPVHRRSQSAASATRSTAGQVGTTRHRRRASGEKIPNPSVRRKGGPVVTLRRNRQRADDPEA